MCCDIVTLVYLQIYIDKHGQSEVIASTFLVIARRTNCLTISFCRALTKLWPQHKYTHDWKEIGRSRKILNLWSFIGKEIKRTKETQITSSFIFKSQISF